MLSPHKPSQQPATPHWPVQPFFTVQPYTPTSWLLSASAAKCEGRGTEPRCHSGCLDLMAWVLGKAGMGKCSRGLHFSPRLLPATAQNSSSFCYMCSRESGKAERGGRPLPCRPPKLAGFDLGRGQARSVW